jgi:phage gpG-like protein
MAGLRIMLIGNEAAQAKMVALPAQMSAAMRKAMERSLALIYRRVMANLTGSVLRVQTGRLRQSVQTEVTSDTTGIIGTNVEYAAIHEYGGQTRPHQYRARGAVMRFVDPRFTGPVQRTSRGGKIFKGARSGVVFAKWIDHPGSTMPARPYMRPALRDSQPEIVEAFRKGIAAVLGAK